MFRKLGDALRRFMYGRYGTDQLGLAMMVLGLVFLIAGRWCYWLFIPAYALLGFYIYRCYSRNMVQRRKENAWFMRLIAPIRDRQHRYFRCPGCRQSVRVPRGKGRIAIRCPKCGARFEKKS